MDHPLTEINSVTYTKVDFLTLLKTNSSRNVADIAVKMLGSNERNFHVVIKLCFEMKYPIAMRAARVIQLVCQKNPALLEPYLDYVIQGVIKSNIDGVKKRNFLKIFSEFIELRDLEDYELLIDKCFEWVASHKETVAVRVLAMSFLHKVAIIEPELKNELGALIFINLKEAPAAFQSRAYKILKDIDHLAED